MADQLTHPYVKVENKLLTEAQNFSFVQAYRLLCKVARAKKQNPNQCILLRPSLDLGLKSSEVEDITLNDGIYTLYLNLPGLYGSKSPLANFYTEELIQAEQNEQEGARVFLDVLQRRLFQLLFSARNDSELCQNESKRIEFQKLLLTLTGFRNVENTAFSELGGLLLQNINTLRYLKGSSNGLEKILTHFFATDDVYINQFQKRWVTIAPKERVLLGQQSHQLGNTVSIGTKIKDVSGKILISIKNIKESRYNKLIARPKNWALMVNLIRYSINQPLLVDICFEMKTKKKSGMTLQSEDWQSLGKNTWLYHCQSKSELPTISATLKVI